MNLEWNLKTILIAEDEPANYLFIEKIVRSTQVTLIRAESGIQAVQLIKENPQIDMVLMDIYMPDMDGFEATRLIKQLRPDIPIVAQTFYENQIEKRKIDSAGFDDFISKPININKLLAIMEKYLTGTSQKV